MKLLEINAKQKITSISKIVPGTKYCVYIFTE